MFKKKTVEKVDIFSASEHFYNSYVFSEDKLAKLAMPAYADVLIKNISEVDSTFRNIDPELIVHELIPIRLELVGLLATWNFNEKTAAQHSIEAQNYLEKIAKLDVWEGMEIYNQAIAASVTSKLPDRKKAKILKQRADLFDKYMDYFKKIDQFEYEEDMRPVVRYINRCWSQQAWKQYRTELYIAAALLENLSRKAGNVEKLNAEAMRRLGYSIRGLYQGIENEIMHP